MTLYAHYVRMIFCLGSRSGAKDRYATLECLAKLATIPYELVHPYKDTVLRKLLLVLDDRKRLVRHMAVRVRNQWSIL